MNTLNRLMRGCFVKSIFGGLAVFLALQVFCLCSAPTEASRKADNIAINNGFTKICDEIKQKIKDKKILSLDLLVYSKNFKMYYDMSSIEDATKINREFFKKSSDYLKKLSDSKTMVEVYEENDKKNDPKYVAAKKAYEPLLKEFEKYFNDPPRIKPARK